MGAIVKGVGSLFGGRKRRREQKKAGRALKGVQRQVDKFDFKNHYDNLQAAQAETQGYEAAQAQGGTLGPAAQAQAGTLGQAQGYDANTVEAAQAAKTNLGEDTGFKNTFQTLQVNTAASDRQAQETDEALATQAENAALTGGGGATALATAAAKSKQGIADSIGAQETQNAQLRAQADQRNQEAGLQQRNTARQANIQQDQFNTGLEQQARLSNQSALNQAAQFGASSQNQFALTQFGAGNQFALQNQSAQNQFALSQFGADNQFAAQNVAAQNQARAFGASAANQASLNNAQYQNQFQLQKAQGAQQQEALKYDRLQQKLGQATQRKNAADQARAQAKADLIGGIAGVADLGFKALTGGLGGGGGS